MIDFTRLQSLQNRPSLAVGFGGHSIRRRARTQVTIEKPQSRPLPVRVPPLLGPLSVCTASSDGGSGPAERVRVGTESVNYNQGAKHPLSHSE